MNSTRKSQRRKYICLGLSVLDQVWSVPEIPDHPTKVIADAYTSFGGGMAATAAVTLSRLGEVVSFWGRAGDDTSGVITSQQLADEGVNVDNYKRFPGASSPAAAVMVDRKGERLITGFRGVGIPEDCSWLPLEEVPYASAVLADMRWISGAEALFRRARNEGVPTILDADVAEPDLYRRILPLTDHAIFSLPGLRVFSPGLPVADALQTALRCGCSIAAVTDGANGTLWRSATDQGSTPVFEVDVVDTTGAGDVFHGAYTYVIGSGGDTENALQFASAAAALKCRKAGGRDGIPSLRELEQFLRDSV